MTRAERSRRSEDRAAALSTLRWVLGGDAVDAVTFRRGFEALPSNLRPLAASLSLCNLAGLAADERNRLLAVERAATVAWMSRRVVVRTMRSALDAAGISVIFLKGIALAEQVYPVPATRAMSDLDVWVRPDDLPHAMRVMSESGFAVPLRHDDPTTPRGPEPIAYLEAAVAGGVVLIEIHTQPASLRSLDDRELASLWSSAAPVGPHALPVLALDAQLLHVCLHATRAHGCVAGLKALVDIAMIVRAWPGAGLWDVFAARVLRVGAAGAVYVPLELARERLGVDVPRTVVDRLTVPSADELVGRAWDLLWSPPPHLPRGTVHLFGADGEEEWLRNRLVLRRALTAEERRRLPPAERPGASAVLRYFWSRVAELAGVFARGELLRPSFWRHVVLQRRGNRWKRDLKRIERRPGPS